MTTSTGYWGKTIVTRASTPLNSEQRSSRVAPLTGNSEVPAVRSVSEKFSKTVAAFASYVTSRPVGPLNHTLWLHRKNAPEKGESNEWCRLRGFEPPTSDLQNRRSTAELNRPFLMLHYVPPPA
jgi:hypothetical protein